MCFLKRQPPRRVVVNLTDDDSDTFSTELRHRMDVVVNVQDVTFICFIKLKLGAIGTKQYSESEIYFCVCQAIPVIVVSWIRLLNDKINITRNKLI